MPTPKLPPLEFDEVSELVCFLQRQPHDPAAVQRILKDKLHFALDLSPGAPRPRCAVPLITALRAAAARPKADPRLRKALGVWRLIPPGNWLVHSTTSFEIHYTHDPGPNQVPAGVVTVAEDVYTHSDGLAASYPTRLVGTLDPNLPAPRFVQELGFFFEDALGVYRSLGFDLPAAPVQVYVAQCPGDMGYSDPADNVILIGPMNYDAGGSLGQVTAHELFHLVQYRYYVPPPNTLHPTYWYEGSADAAITLVNPNFTLWSVYPSCTPLEGGQSYPYATVILWRYLMEQLTKSHDPVDSPTFGADILRRCWECARQQQAIDTPTLAAAVNALTPANVTFADFVFGNNGELLSNETIWGNWLAAWYLKDLQPPVPDSRFCYLPIPRFMLESAPVTACAVGDVVTASLQPWDVSYQEVTLSGAAQPLSLGISAVPAGGSGDPQCLVQVLIISDSGSLLDIIRTTSANYQRIIGAPYGSGTTMGTVGKVVLILGTRAVAANFTCSLQAAAAAPDLMITRRDSPAGCEYQSNWHNASRDSNTPDIWVVQTRSARTKVPMYRLRVRVRNKGNAAASNVTVALAITPSGAHSAVQLPLGWPLLGTIAFPPIPANAEVVGTMVVKPPKLTVVPKRTPVHPIQSTVRLLVSATIVAAADTSLENNVAFREFRLTLP